MIAAHPMQAFTGPGGMDPTGRPSIQMTMARVTDTARAIRQAGGDWGKFLADLDQYVRNLGRSVRPIAWKQEAFLRARADGTTANSVPSIVAGYVPQTFEVKPLQYISPSDAAKAVRTLTQVPEMSYINFGALPGIIGAASGGSSPEAQAARDQADTADRAAATTRDPRWRQMFQQQANQLRALAQRLDTMQTAQQNFRTDIDQVAAAQNEAAAYMMQRIGPRGPEVLGGDRNAYSPQRWGSVDPFRGGTQITDEASGTLPAGAVTNLTQLLCRFDDQSLARARGTNFVNCYASIGSASAVAAAELEAQADAWRLTARKQGVSVSQAIELPVSSILKTLNGEPQFAPLGYDVEWADLPDFQLVYTGPGFTLTAPAWFRIFVTCGRV